MRRRRTNRRSIYEVALPQVHGIGLHGLAELPHRHRSGASRWWRSQSSVVKLAYGLLIVAAGLGMVATAVMIVGSALIH